MTLGASPTVEHHVGTKFVKDGGSDAAVVGCYFRTSLRNILFGVRGKTRAHFPQSATGKFIELPQARAFSKPDESIRFIERSAARSRFANYSDLARRKAWVRGASSCESDRPT